MEVMECPSFHCDIGNQPGSMHHEQLVITVLCKFISPLLKNYSESINDEISRAAAEQRRELLLLGLLLKPDNLQELLKLQLTNRLMLKVR